MPGTVNLDAFIPRRDFNPNDLTSLEGGYDKIFVHDLVNGHHTLSMLRKPDFQRPTNAWSPQQVTDLITAFVNEDLVPAVILWRSKDNYDFVIDGGHRLGSLIAWINGDYGTGSISEDFFANEISSNEKTAKRTEELVEEAIGSYKSIDGALQTADAKASHIEICKKLRHLYIKVQWMKGSGDKAEKSFFKINQQGVRLTKTEIQLLQLRKYPHSLASRSINHLSEGRPFLKDFLPKNRAAIEKIANEINTLLFQPVLKGGKLKTTEVPIGGRANVNSALPLIWDAVKVCNRINSTTEGNLVPDVNGEQTLKFLGNTKKAIYRICNRTARKEKSSLNLHPFVYFYSDSGNHTPASFSAAVMLVQHLESHNSFIRFTLIREQFEEFLISHKDYLQQVHRYARGQTKGVDAIKDYFLFLMASLEGFTGSDPQRHLHNKLRRSEFSYLKDPNTEKRTGSAKRVFPTAVSNAGFIAEKLVLASRCDVCHARIPDYGMSDDHVKKREHGGPNTRENLGFTHKFCNSSRDAIYAARGTTE